MKKIILSSNGIYDFFLVKMIRQNQLIQQQMQLLKRGLLVLAAQLAAAQLLL
jgi:hypothetical protein